MSIENVVRRCAYCRQNTVVPTTVPVYSEEASRKGISFWVDVPNLRILQCNKCGKRVLNEDAGIRIEEAIEAKAKEIGL